MARNGKRALVTGGAGLIGSHVTDLLIRDGWKVRVLDNLEPNTHKRGTPAWINERAEFVEGDVRDRETIAAALDKIDIVFHQAAYGGYMPEIAKFVHVNSLGTAQMLETIREKNLPIKKIVVASSQAVYSEGAGECPKHGLVFPSVRPVEQLRKGDWQVHCPICRTITKSAPTPENAPVGGETVYGLTKVDQERLVLLWGKQVGIPTVALRYSCTYGPRQSIFNPYTGVIAIFCTRLLNNLPPVLYEDGEQTRDFSFVEDIARANLLAAETDKLDGLAVNVGSGAGGSDPRNRGNDFAVRSRSTLTRKRAANFVRAKCAISPATQDAHSRRPVTNRMSNLPKESSATSTGSARNRTFAIISAKPSKF